MRDVSSLIFDFFDRYRNPQPPIFIYQTKFIFRMLPSAGTLDIALINIENGGDGCVQGTHNHTQTKFSWKAEGLDESALA